MSSTMQQSLIDDIIHHIRVTIQNMDNLDADTTWDEMEHGAGWLENEIGLATRFLVKLTSKNSGTYKWNRLHSVAEFNEALQHLSLQELAFIKHVVVDLRGTENSFLFELQDLPKKIVKAYFENH